MLKYTMYFGLSRKDHSTINVDVVISWVTSQLANHGVDGATMITGVGVWEGVLEKTLIVSTCDDRDLSSIVRLIARIYAHDFMQDAVMCETCETNVAFVSF